MCSNSAGNKWPRAEDPDGVVNRLHERGYQFPRDSAVLLKPSHEQVFWNRSSAQPVLLMDVLACVVVSFGHANFGGYPDSLSTIANIGINFCAVAPHEGAECW